MNDDNDNLTGIFDDLTPEDFATPKTTAFHASTYPDVQYPEGQEGESAFTLFIEECLRATRYSFNAADGNINPIAILASPTLRRSFAPDNDEIVGQYVARLAREAKLMGARWFFISQITQTGWFEDRPDSPASDSPEAVKAATEGGRKMTKNVYWYAERRETDSETRHGVIEILGKTKLGEAREGIPQSATIYGAVLSETPAKP